MVVCLNPEAIEQYPNPVLPQVHNMVIDYFWLEVASVWGKPTCDMLAYPFCYGMNRTIVRSKQNDIGYPALLESIDQDGFHDPVFWDGEEYGNGHHRFAVAVELGYTHIPATDDEDFAWLDSHPVSAHDKY